MVPLRVNYEHKRRKDDEGQDTNTRTNIRALSAVSLARPASGGLWRSDTLRLQRASRADLWGLSPPQATLLQRVVRRVAGLEPDPLHPVPSSCTAFHRMVSCRHE